MSPLCSHGAGLDCKLCRDEAHYNAQRALLQWQAGNASSVANQVGAGGGQGMLQGDVAVASVGGGGGQREYVPIERLTVPLGKVRKRLADIETNRQRCAVKGRDCDACRADEREADVLSQVLRWFEQ